MLSEIFQCLLLIIEAFRFTFLCNHSFSTKEAFWSILKTTTSSVYKEDFKGIKPGFHITFTHRRPTGDVLAALKSLMETLHFNCQRPTGDPPATHRRPTGDPPATHHCHCKKVDSSSSFFIVTSATLREIYTETLLR